MLELKLAAGKKHVFLCPASGPSVFTAYQLTKLDVCIAGMLDNNPTTSAANYVLWERSGFFPTHIEDAVPDPNAFVVVIGQPHSSRELVSQLKRLGLVMGEDFAVASLNNLPNVRK